MSAQANGKFCVNCGERIDQKAEICPKCGVRQPMMAASAPQGKNKLTAAILAIILGGLGVHKFYLGQTTMGILYLVFCWTFIPVIVSFIEGVLFLVMTDEAFDSKYNSAATA